MPLYFVDINHRTIVHADSPEEAEELARDELRSIFGEERGAATICVNGEPIESLEELTEPWDGSCYAWGHEGKPLGELLPAKKGAES